MINPIKIIYKNTILTTNGTIANEGPKSPAVIIFRNQGTSIAYILGNVAIIPGTELVLKNDPGIVIENSFTVVFDTSIEGTKNNLSVIRGYYKE